tara:strand:- start:272 stop:568 length:297 start_codon:yes stop_codon:yes gene_type:complete
MAKNTSKKIKELKGIKPEKVTKEQLADIQKIVVQIEQLHMKIGQLESSKHANLHLLAGVNDEMNVMQEKLKTEYGTNDININDGKINYPQNGEVNKED